MTRTIEAEFINQARWNSYGTSALAQVDTAPERFVVDLACLSASQASLIAALPDVAGKQVLDFGAGRGELSVALAKLGAVVTGIDIGKDLIAVARRVAAINNVECDFVVGSIDKLTFPNDSFDFIVGKAILHHLPIRGVCDALSEAYRVLKPGGMAVFFEPLEDSRVFDFLQNLVPIGKAGMPGYRPSILQRARWKAFLQIRDDRALSTAELVNAKGFFREIEFRYSGLLIRLRRLFPSPTIQAILERIDSVLTHKLSPVRKLAQTVFVTYRK